MAADIQIPLDIPDSSGNGYRTAIATANIRQVVSAFLKDVVGDWWGIVEVPSNFSSNAAVVLSIAANATSGVTTMGVASLLVADTEVYDAALTAETDQDITVPATAYKRKDVSFSLTPTVAAGDHLLVRIRHNGTATNDTLAVDTLLFAAAFRYTAA